MRVPRESDGRVLPVGGQPLAAGGEAVVSELPALPDRFAKVYHRPAAEHAAKLAAMLAAPPADPMAGSGHVSIAWPADRLLAADGSRTVIGCLLPRVDGALPAFQFHHPRSRLRLRPPFPHRPLARPARQLTPA